MSSINNAIYNILTKNKFCFLCYEGVEETDLININDEVAVKFDQTTEYKSITNILLSVLGRVIIDYTKTFTIVCVNCMKCAIDSYIFLKNSLRNVECLNSTIEGLANSIEFTTVENNSKSLYVTLNLDDFTSTHYYDIGSPSATAAETLKQIQSKDSLKLQPKVQEEIQLKQTIKKDPYSMNQQNMLLNNTDLIKCRKCEKTFKNLGNLHYHFFRAHKKNFKCKECGSTYGSENLLERHKYESHIAVICSQCGKTFTNRYTLKQHELGHTFMIMCQDCGRSYKSQSTFKKHKELNICGRESRASQCNAKYTCDYCNKKYTQKVSLRVHIQYEHGNYKAHVCEWCGKKFWAKSRLNAHIVKHTKERNFSCEVCGGKFVTKTSLLYHSRRHTGERPYNCPYCDSRFLSSSRKNAHIKRAHKDSKFECDVCHSKFSSMMYLRKHRQKHDLKKVTEEKIKIKNIWEKDMGKVIYYHESNSGDSKNTVEENMIIIGI